jgi:hypothetical protein
MFIFRRTALLFASAVSAGSLGLGALGLGALPADAATTQAAAGSVLCNGDVCLQTISVNTSNHTAQVNAWAATKTLNPGFFILSTPPDSSGVSSFEYSPTKEWPAGGTHYTFTIPLLHGTYDMTAYSGKPPGTLVGNKTFGINF